MWQKIRNIAKEAIVLTGKLALAAFVFWGVLMLLMILVAQSGLLRG